MDRTATLNALLSWVDRGVLKEERGHFRLLEQAGDSAPPRTIGPRPIIEESITTITQQQQAAQMHVYWKACIKLYEMISF